MPIRPFWFVARAVLTANASGTLKIPAGAGEKIILDRAFFDQTGTFSITAIRDDSGLAYSNASPTVPITSALILNDPLEVSAIQYFRPPLAIEGPNGLNIDIIDTSGAGNTVRVTLEGSKDTG